MLRIFLLLFLLFTFFQLKDYFQTAKTKGNDIMLLNEALEETGKSLEGVDSVFYFTNKESNELKFKLQFILSPVRLVTPQTKQDLTGQYGLYLIDNHAETVNISHDISNATIQQQQITKDSAFSITLYRF